MAWIEVTLDHLKGKLTGPEVSALQTAALAEGQQDPIPEETERVVREVRGYVAACKQNVIAPGITIPEELLDATLAILVVRINTRLPSKVLLTEERMDAKNDALRLMNMVAQCNFGLAQPEEASDEQFIITTPSFVGRERKYRDQDGI